MPMTAHPPAVKLTTAARPPPSTVEIPIRVSREAGGTERGIACIIGVAEPRMRSLPTPRFF